MKCLSNYEQALLVVTEFAGTKNGGTNGPEEREK